LHGWDATTAEGQRLLARQALLDAIVRQTAPGMTGRAFATPLNALNVTVPAALADAAWQTVTRAASETFNPWGELYSALIPQPYRRQIGQFWTFLVRLLKLKAKAPALTIPQVCRCCSACCPSAPSTPSGCCKISHFP
jgi:hypothetical protein